MCAAGSSGDGHHHVLYRRFSGEEERPAGVFPCHLQVGFNTHTHTHTVLPYMVSVGGGFVRHKGYLTPKAVCTPVRRSKVNSGVIEISQGATVSDRV